jgi:RNA polymerase sigma-32 factor
MDDPRVDLDPEVLVDPTGDSEEPSQAMVRSRGGLPATRDPFYAYMREIRRYPPLEREEEVELARLYRDTGDREALFRLLTSNLMMVARVALSFRRAAKKLLDLIQEGNLGLIAAIDRFDPDLGVRLPTYAAWWVRAYMVKYLLDNVRLVRVGTTNARRKLLRNLRKEKQKLESMGIDVTPRLLADRFDVKEHDVVEVEAALHGRDLSLDAPRGDEADGESFGAYLPDGGPALDDSLARQELQEQTERALEEFRKDLKEKDRIILDERLLAEDPRTLADLGKQFGTSREAVRQAEARLKKKVGSFLRERLVDVGQFHYDS